MSTTAYEPTAAAVEPPSPGPLHRRILDTYLSPGELFARFGQTPPWIGVLLIAVAVIAGAMALIPESVWIETARAELAGNPQTAGMDPSQMVGMVRVFGIVSQLIVQPIAALVAAGLLTLLFGVFMSSGTTFRQHLAIVSHATLIPALGMLVTLPLIVRRESLETRLSLSLLTPFLDPESFLFRFLGAIDLFTIWYLAVIALGVATLGRKISFAKAGITVFGAYLLLTAGFIALGPDFGG